MSHPAGKRRTVFYAPGYNKGDMNDDIETRVLNRAKRARQKNKRLRYFQYSGIAVVWSDGRFRLWESVAPSRIGRD